MSTQQQQHFVYAEFVSPAEAERAVSALVDNSFDPDEIDVLSVRGREVERVPLQHHRPVVMGAVCGLGVGVLAGLVVGLISRDGSAADTWTATTRWILLGAANGFLAGALGGLVWWRSGVRIKGALAQAQRFVVGTIVTDTRSEEVSRVLQQLFPLRSGSYPVTGSEIARQHAERMVLPTP
jgi:hypothetical protein